MRVLRMSLAALLVAVCGAATVQAAFIVEPGVGGKAQATNFVSTDGSPTTSAVGTAVGLSGVGSVFGGSGAIDEWVFSYTPGTDADNTVLAAGTLLGDTRIDPPGNPAGVSAEILRSAGFEGGASGTYRVFITSIPSGNVNPAGSTVTITNDGAPIVINPVDFNSTTGTGGGPTPSGVGAANQWLLIGTVELTAGNTYSVTQLANAPTFVGQRGAGVMWEKVPEPSTIALAGLALVGVAFAARRRVR